MCPEVPRDIHTGSRTEVPISRRRMVDWLLGTSLGAFLLSVLYPIARYLVPPASAESSVASVTLPIKASEVKANSGHIFKFGNRPAILIRTARGELRAYSAICTHLNCTVQVPTRHRAHLVRMPRRPLRPQRTQHPGASAPAARDVRRECEERRNRREEDFLATESSCACTSRAFVTGWTRESA